MQLALQLFDPAAILPRFHGAGRTRLAKTRNGVLLPGIQFRRIQTLFAAPGAATDTEMPVELIVPDAFVPAKAAVACTNDDGTPKAKFGRDRYADAFSREFNNGKS